MFLDVSNGSEIGKMLMVFTDGMVVGIMAS